MKYRISKENIEFLAEAAEQPALVKAIVETMVPKLADKLYFYSPESSVREAVSDAVGVGLVVVNDSSVETFHRYKRIHYYRGCTSLVPVLSGIVKKSEWATVCEKIAALNHQYA